MKAWCIGPQSGREGLQLNDLPDPVAGPGEISVQIIAAGLNYRDLMVLEGRYGQPQPSTRVPGADGVGVIEAIGEGVTGLSLGQRVIAPHFVNWLDGPYNFGVFGRDLGVTADGWLADKIVLPASAAIALPDNISDATAATLSVACSTVWHAMMAFGDLKPGELMLVPGTGGMAIFAMQLAKAMGAQVAITSSSDAKLEKCHAMGADYTVNYRTHEDWVAELLKATGGRGADVVVDTIGFGAMPQLVAATAVNARIGSIGALSGGHQDGISVGQGAFIGKNITLKGIASGSRKMLSDALDVVATKGVEMLIDREFAFDHAHAALAHLESGAHMGKILVRI